MSILSGFAYLFVLGQGKYSLSWMGIPITILHHHAQPLRRHTIRSKEWLFLLVGRNAANPWRRYQGVDPLLTVFERQSCHYLFLIAWNSWTDSLCSMVHFTYTKGYGRSIIISCLPFRFVLLQLCLVRWCLQLFLCGILSGYTPDFSLSASLLPFWLCLSLSSSCYLEKSSALGVMLQKWSLVKTVNKPFSLSTWPLYQMAKIFATFPIHLAEKYPKRLKCLPPHQTAHYCMFQWSPELPEQYCTRLQTTYTVV